MYNACLISQCFFDQGYATGAHNGGSSHVMQGWGGVLEEVDLSMDLKVV